MRPRTRALVWVLGVLALALAAAATWVWLDVRSTEAAWERVHARAAVLATARASGERPHAPLRGTPRAGEATQHYLLATKESDEVDLTIDGGDVALEELIAQRDLPQNAADLVARCRPALDALAAGAMSDRIQFDAFREATVEVGSLMEPILGYRLDECALVAARHDLARDLPDAALQLAADALTLARDQMQTGLRGYEWTGARAVVNFTRLWTDDTLAKLPPPLQRELAEILQRFDAETPAASQVARTSALLAVELARFDPGKRLVLRIMAWLDEDLAELCVEPEQFDAYFDAIEALPAATAPWSVREAALEAADAHLTFDMKLANMEQTRREALTRVRLLRIAIAHHLGEPLPALADPLGDGDLQVSQRNDEIVIRSDGVAYDYEDDTDKPIHRVVRRR